MFWMISYQANRRCAPGCRLALAHPSPRAARAEPRPGKTEPMTVPRPFPASSRGTGGARALVLACGGPCGCTDRFVKAELPACPHYCSAEGEMLEVRVPPPPRAEFILDGHCAGSLGLMLNFVKVCAADS